MLKCGLVRNGWHKNVLSIFVLSASLELSMTNARLPQPGMCYLRILDLRCIWMLLAVFPLAVPFLFACIRAHRYELLLLFADSLFGKCLTSGVPVMGITRISKAREGQLGHPSVYDQHGNDVYFSKHPGVPMHNESRSMDQNVDNSNTRDTRQTYAADSLASEMQRHSYGGPPDPQAGYAVERGVSRQHGSTTSDKPAWQSNTSDNDRQNAHGHPQGAAYYDAMRDELGAPHRCVAASSPSGGFSRYHQAWAYSSEYLCVQTWQNLACTPLAHRALCCMAFRTLFNEHTDQLAVHCQF